MRGELFIYLYINFAKRPGSLTEQAPLQGPKFAKLVSETDKVAGSNRGSYGLKVCLI